MNLDFQSTVLSKKQIKFLKDLHKNKSLSTNLSKSDIKELIKLELIKYDNFEQSHELNIPMLYSLTDKGIRYIYFVNKDIFRFTFPVALSLIALIISIISLYLQLS